VSTMEATRDADPAAEDRHAIFTAWATDHGTDRGFLVSEIVEEAEKLVGSMPLRPNLRPAVLQIAADHRNLNTVHRHRLQNWLNKNVNMISGRHKLVCDRTDRSRPRWRLVFWSP